MSRQITGLHVLAGFVAMFGLIIAVNLTMAFNAVRTFPGLEVANSYVASQQFDAKRTAQEALGWSADADYRDGRLHIALTDAAGAPAPVDALELTVGRPTMQAEDRHVVRDAMGDVALDLAPGLWRLDIAATAHNGTDYAHTLTFRVRP